MRVTLGEGYPKNSHTDPRTVVDRTRDAADNYRLRLKTDWALFSNRIN